MGRLGGFRSFGALGAAVLALGVACAGRSVGDGERGTAGGTGGTGGTSGAGATGGSHLSGGTSGTAGTSASGGMSAGGTSAGGTSAGGTSAGGTSAGGTSAGGTSAGGESGTGGILPPDFVTCGNLAHDELEECDDGNRISGDGCGLFCLVERDAVCPVVGPCILDGCGNGRAVSYEACDDGNTLDDDGCSGDCKQVEPGWICPGEGLPCRPRCGDAMLVGAEECDDGNDQSGDGCSRACRVERPLCAMDLPAEAGAAGAPSESEPPADDAGARVACVTPVCGDGVVMAPEDCDDGEQENVSRYGGCSGGCSYADFCGDGVVNGPEECDSGTANAVGYGTMGCSQACHFAPYCGDGFIDAEFGEQCDDGVRNGTTFCRNDCTIDVR